MKWGDYKNRPASMGQDMRTFEYRLYPNRKQHGQLLACLHESRGLYNEMLGLLKDHHAQTGKFLFKNELCALFKGRSGEHVPASTVQMLADRLDKALTRYLDGKAKGDNVGFPRFKSANRWRSIDLRQYPQDFRLSDDNRYLVVPHKLGRMIKIKLHRPFTGKPKQAHLVRRADRHWYVLIVCQTEPHEDIEQLHSDTEACEHGEIGLDMGLNVFLADSNGNMIPNPRYLRRSSKALRRKQRTLSRRKKGSQRWKKAARLVAQTHLKVARQRRDFAHKAAKHYAQHYRRIVVENLHTQGLIQNRRLAKSILDVGWYIFFVLLAEKAERAGHEVIRVSPYNTSQMCSNCGALVPKGLSVRVHHCQTCGYVADRDVNAAINILRAGAPPSGTVSQ